MPLQPTPDAHMTRRDIPAYAPPPKPGETAWIGGAVLPVQIGVYRRLSLAGLTNFSYFDGAHWLWTQQHPVAAVRMPSTQRSLSQLLPWCGLLAPPPQGYGPLRTDDMGAPALAAS